MGWALNWTRMRWVLVRVLLALALMLGFGGPGGTAYAQLATTRLADTIYHADGSAATGSVIVSWGSFTTATGTTVQAGSETVTIEAGGALSVSLAPNSGANPIGSYYTAVYHLDDGSVQREFWVTPVSQYPVKLSQVKSTVVPTSVAMQTVTKNYVDTAIAAAVTGFPLDSSPYVVKTGDTMTGALVLPGDPVSANQAADKHYVDINVAGLSSGGSSKVSLSPTTTQVVIQPTGTDLETTRLNQVEYASQYENGLGNNGVANATASADCTGASAAGLGCMVVAEPGLAAGELLNPATWPNSTYVVDDRQGGHHENFFNPNNPVFPGSQVGHAINLVSTESAQEIFARTTNNDPGSVGLEIDHFGLAGGTNLFPEQLETPPYFKSTYNALSVNGSYYTIGQHVLNSQVTYCYAVGDCLIGSQFINSMGGFRDSADEGTHPFDLQVHEDPRVFQGTCSSGCATGSQSVTVGGQVNPQTQGEGRFLIDKNPSKTITQGVLTGGSNAGIHPVATFSGSNFAVSTFFQTASLLPSQSNNISPGTVPVQIVTSGVPAGYSTNTGAAPSGSGVACISDRQLGGAPQNYEMVTYSVSDGTHFQMTLAKPHGPLSTIAIGGLCGYGIEQTVDTANGIRQVFPVIGSTSATSLIYSGAQTPIVGVMGATSAFQNISLTILSAVRNNNVVTVTLSGTLQQDVNGLHMTIAGASDSSYNGSFNVTTTSNSTLTYAQSGANSSSTGGTISLLTGAYVLYPMAEVLSVYNPTTALVDGLMTLAPNNVAWAANDSVEEPHYWQVIVSGDTEFISQVTPRPILFQSPGYQYDGTNGPGLRGFQIVNASPASNYLGTGGTHNYPDVAYVESGIWRRTFDVQAGEQALMTVHCNSKGCGDWNSPYNLFELDSSVGSDAMTYSPQSSNLNMSFRGTNYSFSPQAFSAGTANIRTLNVGTINVSSMAMDTVTMAAATAGIVTANKLVGALDASNVSSGTMAAARLPVMGASGANHALGAVPDPGANAGTTRFLREDGTWSVPAGESAGSGSSGVSGAGGALAVSASLNAGLLADYNFFQQSGTTLSDVSGNGNDGTFQAGSLAPTWSGEGLAFLPGQGVSLPAALNPAESFVIEAYLNPLTAGGQLQDNYPSLVTNSNGVSGIGLMTDYETSSTSYAGNYTYAPAIYGGGSPKSAAPNLVSGFHVLGYVLGTGGSNVDRFYIDGTEVGTYQQQGASAGLQTAGNLYFGSSNVQPWTGSGLNGTAYRMRAYSRQLSAGEVTTLTQAMEGEVAQRGVATSVVPANLAVPQFHAIGDSLTFGFLAPSPWPALMTLANQPSYNIVNWGIVGIPLQAINASEANRVAPRCKTATGSSVAVVFAGTNDFASLGGTPQSVFGNLLGEIATLKAGGCKVYAGTMISRGGTGVQGESLDSDKDAFDALILSQAKLAGADGVIDFAASPLLGADGANTSIAFDQDKIHVHAMGQQILANEASNALNYYAGSTAASPSVVTASTYTMASGDRYVQTKQATTLTAPDCLGPSGETYTIENSGAASTIVGLPSGGGTASVNLYNYQTDTQSVLISEADGSVFAGGFTGFASTGFFTLQAGQTWSTNLAVGHYFANQVTYGVAYYDMSGNYIGNGGTGYPDGGGGSATSSYTFTAPANGSATTVQARFYYKTSSSANPATAAMIVEGSTIPSTYSAYSAGGGAGPTIEPINGSTSAVTIPANSTMLLTDVANPKTVAGCHWTLR